MQTEARVVPMSRARSFATGQRQPEETHELEPLLKACARGDEAAWAWIMVRFGGCIRAVARTYRLSAADTEDVIQHTWMRLFENAGAIREPERLSAWLRTTARHESLRLLRAADRERPTEGELFERQPAQNDDDAELLKEAKRLAAFRSAIQVLPPRDRQLVRTLVAEPHASYAEISRALEMPIGSIGPTRGRAIVRLRRHAELVSAA